MVKIMTYFSRSKKPAMKAKKRRTKWFALVYFLGIFYSSAASSDPFSAILLFIKPSIIAVLTPILENPPS